MKIPPCPRKSYRFFRSGGARTRPSAAGGVAFPSATQVPHCFAGRVLPVTEAITEDWGRTGWHRPDGWRPLRAPGGTITATGSEGGLTLATRNVKDFAGLGVVPINP